MSNKARMIKLTELQTQLLTGVQMRRAQLNEQLAAVDREAGVILGLIGDQHKLDLTAGSLNLDGDILSVSYPEEPELEPEGDVAPPAPARSTRRRAN